MTKPLKAELQAWLEKLKQDKQNAPEKYSNCGQLFRLPDGLPIAPELLTKWYRLWRAEHSEFEQIVFHGLRHFYSQDLTPAAPQPRQNEKPAATKISGKEILEAIRLMDADERRESMRALFA